jgi:cytochrome P450
MTQACSKPEEFMPERYLDDPTLCDPRDLVFGFGRRICPGQHFAEANIWLAIARIVATFEISRMMDNQGEEINPPASFIDGVVW